MDTATFLKKFAEVLEVSEGSITTADRLDSLGSWDSLAVVRFLAYAQLEHQVKVGGVSLRACQTVADLMRLLD